MRVVHVPFGYFPDPVGGTEVYVATLARALRDRSVESVIAAPAPGGSGALASDRYVHEGTPVIRFATGLRLDVDAVYGGGDSVAAAALESILDDVGADIVHLHSFTSAASMRVVRAAHRRGMAVVFTYHTPTASCVRGTLLRDGREPCNGVLDERRCTSCLLQSRGVPQPARGVLALGPVSLGRAPRAASRWATAIRARELVGAQHSAFRSLVAEADAVVAVCGWVHELLVRAGAPPERLFLSPHGVSVTAAGPMRSRPGTTGVRLAFLGRLDPSKGLHIVLDALSARRDLPVSLDIFGVVQDDGGRGYAAALARAAAADQRITFRDPIPADQVVGVLSGYDATVVPSQWLETGPLTVLESFAAGAPVIGSRMGGIGELVRHEHDGLLVPHDDVRAWTGALVAVATDRALLHRLRAGVRPPRSSADVATDMVAVYRAAVMRTAASPAPVAPAAGVA